MSLLLPMDMKIEVTWQQGARDQFCHTHYDDWVRVMFCTTLFPHHASRSNGSKSADIQVQSSDNNMTKKGSNSNTNTTHSTPD